MDSNNHKKSAVPRDVSFDNLKDILADDTNEQKRGSTQEHSRPSIKSLFTKKFPPLKSSTSINISSKPKKSRTSFRHFSQLLKRSHSAHNDLSSTNHSSHDLPIEPVYPITLQVQNSHEFNSNLPPRPLNTTTSSGLGPISEEDNSQPIRSKIITDDIDRTNGAANLSKLVSSCMHDIAICV